MPSPLFGGDASPLGWVVQYLDAPQETVLGALGAIPDLRVDMTPVMGSLRTALHALLPFESPWTRELVLPCGGWTAYLNNGLNGGDSSARGLAVGRDLGVRTVVAEHTLRYGPGHQATQLWVHGPDGAPPLMVRRTLSATATDGRWHWEASGEPFAFEDTSRYTARRVRDRFDRGLLIRYLGHLGIPADDANAYGEAMLVQWAVTWQRRTVTLDQARSDLG